MLTRIKCRSLGGLSKAALWTYFLLWRNTLRFEQLVICSHLQAHVSGIFCFFNYHSFLVTSLSYCGETDLKFGTFQPLLTPVGHRLDRQEVGGRRQQAVQPQLALRLLGSKREEVLMRGKRWFQVGSKVKSNHFCHLRPSVTARPSAGRALQRLTDMLWMSMLFDWQLIKGLLVNQVCVDLS